ncbi:hypothetical protein BDW71DRAFT_188251 [Aspergillus fruticulosus]
MPFAHTGLEAARTRLGHPVPVSPIATAGTWKLLVCLLAGAQLGLIVSAPIIQFNIWLFLYNLSMLSALVPAISRVLSVVPSSALGFWARLTVCNYLQYIWNGSG